MYRIIPAREALSSALSVAVREAPGDVGAGRIDGDRLQGGRDDQIHVPEGEYRPRTAFLMARFAPLHLRASRRRATVFAMLPVSPARSA
jgi:hypothetical protein